MDRWAHCRFSYGPEATSEQEFDFPECGANPLNVSLVTWLGDSPFKWAQSVDAHNGEGL